MSATATVPMVLRGSVGLGSPVERSDDRTRSTVRHRTRSAFRITRTSMIS